MEFDPATEVPERESVPAEYRWNPDALFDGWDDWRREYDRVSASVDSYAADGDPVTGAGMLAETLDRYNALHERVLVLHMYAYLHALQDRSDDHAKTRLGEAEDLESRLEDAASGIEPAIQAIDADRLNAFCETNRLATYDRYLDDVLRQVEHTLSPETESALAKLERPLRSPARVLDTLTNEAFDAPEVERPDGETVAVTSHTRTRLLRHENRAFRERVDRAFLAELAEHRHASAQAFADHVERGVVLADLRGYDSSLDATLGGEFSVAAYEALVDGIRDSLDPFHRHLEQYREATDGDDLRLWDVQVSLAEGESPTIPYERACDLAVEAVAPLGGAYQNRLAEFLDSDRVDVFETEGKQSDMRAMNVTADGGGSFVHLNYKNDLRSLYFFVHELGHAMHQSLYSEAQAHVNASYPGHVVEIPSFVHEALLTDHLLSGGVDARYRDHVVETVLGKLPLRVGAQWSSFVRAVHDAVERGEHLSAERLDELYGDVQSEFLAPVDLEPRDDHRWLVQQLSRDPHFSYRYLVGICGALTVADRLRSGDLSSDTYRGFLRAGESEPTGALLERLDLDYASGRPVERALDTYDRYVDELA